MSGESVCLINCDVDVVNGFRPAVGLIFSCSLIEYDDDDFNDDVPTSGAKITLFGPLVVLVARSYGNELLWFSFIA